MLVVNNLNNFSKNFINNTNTNANNTHQPHFTALPKKAVSDIRNISHLPCACCGNTMINPIHFNEYLKFFIPNSKRALENQSLDKYRSTQGFSFLSNLSALNPKKNMRDIISLDSVQTQIRNLPPNIQIEVNEILSCSDKVTKNSAMVMKKLSKYYNNFSDGTKKLLDVMEGYSSRYPYKTFFEIFNTPEIAQYHKESMEAIKKQSLSSSINVFRQLQSLKGLNFQDKKQVQEINANVLAILNSDNYRPVIHKALVTNLYENWASNLANPSLHDDIMNIIKDIPYDNNYPNVFISNCVNNKLTDLDIVKTISEELLATFEHILPKSQNGENIISNGIVLCRKCNKERSDLPYSFFLKFHPEMINNMQKQINKVISFIKNGKLIGYDSYPVDVKKTLLAQSDNKIKINIRKFLYHYDDVASKKLENAEKAYAVDEQKLNKTSEKISSIDAKLEEAISIVRKLKKERKVLQTELDSLIKNKDFLELNVLEKENNVKEITNLIDEDILLDYIVKIKRKSEK